MRKILACFVLFLGLLQSLRAIPAYPGKIQVTQPDGSVITIRLHGDEWLHYATDEQGQVVARDQDGFYRPAERPSAQQIREALALRKAARQLQVARAAAAAASGNQGTQRIPVILVNFSDKSFVIDNPQEAFSNMLNQEGYSVSGGTGSVRDYYVENSHGAYEPVFDVYGPTTVSRTSSYYAQGQTQNADKALKEACTNLNGEIDFSRYDSNNDGYVDLAVMIFAGHNQAEGGGTDTIWPHQGSTSGRYDNKNLGNYLCVSELKGAAGKTMCGVGTMAHEFGHFLGLPDFYDADYEEHGQCQGLYSYSLMSSGSYNNNGRTPPYLNSEELRLLGWMDEQPEITSKGALTIAPIQDRVAYRVPTSKDGEYFVLECRKKTGWDSKLPGSGLLVYHVDKSSNIVAESYTAADFWNRWHDARFLYYNDINSIGDHPCFYLVPAADQQNLNYSGREDYIPFPYRTVNQYTPVDWNGVESDFKFSGISFDGNQVTMTVSYTTVIGISGTVMNTSAKPVRGAVVSVYSPSRPNTPLKTATTDVDGLFNFEDETLTDGTYTVSVTCQGYVSADATVSVGRKLVIRDFYLRKVGESEESTFRRYDPSGSSFVSYGNGTAGSSIAASIKVTASEASAHAGKQLKLISFQLSGTEASSADAVYVFVESAGRRQFTQKVDSPRFGEMNTVNVIGQEYFLTAGQDLYIGYGLVNASEANPILVQKCSSDDAGYTATFNANSSRAMTWSTMSQGNNLYTPVLSAAVGERVEPELGFNYIANPGNGTYRAGDRFDLTLVRYEDDAPSAVSWTFDGQRVQGGSVTLSAGSHTVEAHLTYSDGATEVIRLVIQAQ